MLAVTAPAPDRSLLTLAELRAAAGVADASKDTELSALGEQVAAAIAAACRVASAGAAPPTLRMETLTEQFRLDKERLRLILARRPVVAVASVTSGEESLDEGDYEVEAAAGLLTRLSGGCMAPWMRGKIVVVYGAGWQTVPADLKLAASKLAKSYWAEGSRRDPGLKRESIPGVIEKEWWVSEAAARSVPEDVMQLLHAGGYVEHWV